MGVSSFKRILKGIDKTIDTTSNVANMSGKVLNKASKGAEFLAKDAIITGTGVGKTGLDIARKVKKWGFEEMSEEALSNSTNILEHITGMRAKKSTNALAFAAVVGYSGLNIADDVEKTRGMGTIVGADFQPNMINPSINPITEQTLEEYEQNERIANRVNEQFHDDFGSAGPDLVFALHELRNR